MILVALAVAAITMTLTQSSLFKNIQEYKLFRCPYCAAHYISLLVWCGYAVQYPNTLHVFDFIINIFATVALSVLPMIVIGYFNTKMDKNAKVLHSSHGKL